jgi:hypothetical protein
VNKPEEAVAEVDGICAEPPQVMRDSLGGIFERFELVEVIELEKKIGGHDALSQFFPCARSAWVSREPNADGGMKRTPASPTRKRKNADRSIGALEFLRSPLSCCRAHRRSGVEAPARVNAFTRGVRYEQQKPSASTGSESRPRGAP